MYRVAYDMLHVISVCVARDLHMIATRPRVGDSSRRSEEIVKKKKQQKKINNNNNKKP